MAAFEGVGDKSSGPSSCFEVVHEVTAYLDDLITDDRKIGAICIFGDVHAGDSVAVVSHEAGLLS